MTRGQPGEAHWNAKLTEEDVEAIRKRYEGGEHQVDLAREYGVSRSLVNKIIKGKAWRD